MFQSLKTRLILSRVIIFFLRVGVRYIHVLFLIMLIRLGFLSRPHSSLFSNLQKHLSSLTHHENKERGKWGNSFRFQWRLHCLRINCFLYSLRFLLWGFRFFFEDGEKKLLYHWDKSLQILHAVILHFLLKSNTQIFDRDKFVFVKKNPKKYWNKITIKHFSL